MVFGSFFWLFQEAGRVFTEKIALIFKRPASALQSLDKTKPFQDEDIAIFLTKYKF